jgi:hypothetical protein
MGHFVILFHSGTGCIEEIKHQEVGTLREEKWETRVKIAGIVVFRNNRQEPQSIQFEKQLL